MTQKGEAGRRRDGERTDKEGGGRRTDGERTQKEGREEWEV